MQQLVGQLVIGIAEMEGPVEHLIPEEAQVQIHQGKGEHVVLRGVVKTHVGAVHIKVAAVGLEDDPADDAVDIQVLGHIIVIFLNGKTVVLNEAVDFPKAGAGVPGLLPLGHGVRVVAVVVGVMLGGVGFADVVGAPILAVDVQNSVFIVLRGQLREALDGQLVHDVVAHLGGVVVLLGGAEQNGGKLRDAVIRL